MRNFNIRNFITSLEDYLKASEVPTVFEYVSENEELKTFNRTKATAILILLHEVKLAYEALNLTPQQSPAVIAVVLAEKEFVLKLQGVDAITPNQATNSAAAAAGSTDVAPNINSQQQDFEVLKDFLQDTLRMIKNMRATCNQGKHFKSGPGALEGILTNEIETIQRNIDSQKRFIEIKAKFISHLRSVHKQNPTAFAKLIAFLNGLDDSNYDIYELEQFTREQLDTPNGFNRDQFQHVLPFLNHIFEGKALPDKLKPAVAASSDDAYNDAVKEAGSDTDATFVHNRF